MRHIKKNFGHPLRTPNERHERITEMKNEYKIIDLCAALDVSTSGYYAHLHRQSHPGPRAQEDAALTEQITTTFARSHGTYGAPRIQAELRKPDTFTPSRKRIARLMRKARLSGRVRRRYKVKTTDSNHAGPIAPNHLKEKPKPTGPNQIWRTDITYIETDEGWLYLCSNQDEYSRKQIGWAMSEKIDTKLVLEALEMARSQRKPEVGLIIHSDRGVQYASEAYRAKLEQMKAIPSMSRKANCYDNAAMESFWSTLKLERVYREKYKTKEQARARVHEYLCYYNQTRRHSALGYQSPLDYENQNK
jgi:putative transposase